MTRRSQYPPELRERAVRMVAEVTPNYDSQWAAIGAVAQKLEIGTAETVRKWVRQAEVDAGQRPGTTTDESAEIKRLKREVGELRRANEILKAASTFIAAELDRPFHRSLGSSPSTLSAPMGWTDQLDQLAGLPCDVNSSKPGVTVTNTSTARSPCTARSRVSRTPRSRAQQLVSRTR
jgi:transposase